jgi:hypothetical protein
MATVRNILLIEYFNTITLFAGKNLFNESKIFEHFKYYQENDFQTWTGSSPNKKNIWVKTEYIELILLTLPEKLME